MSRKKSGIFATSEKVSGKAGSPARESIWQKIRKYKVSYLLKGLVYLAAIVTLGACFYMIIYILVKGIPALKPSLFAPEYNSENVSMLPSIVNTFLMTVLTLLFSVPTGICASIYMHEYAKSRNRFVKVVRIMAQTLTGIPSIVYGLFGMLFFVEALKCGMSLLAGALTLAIMVLPVIMRTSEEALISVPDSYRQASFGLGAGKLATIFRVVLPSAVPGILSGVILAIGRITGETAALMYTAGTVAKLPKSIFSSTRILAVHMYSLSREGLHMNEANATAVVLMVVVIIINFCADLAASRITKNNQ